MRAMFSGFVGAGLIVTRMAVAEPCAKPTERAAFDVTALKSQLMVTALSCNAQERYNAFVTKYRNDLVKGDRALGSYFGRASSRSARQDHDDYITNLANTQSEAGIRLGAAFCNERLAMFDQVMALHSMSELPRFAAGQPIVQPKPLTDCAAPARRTRTARADTAGHSKH
jgi:hypothetical protein